MATGRSAQLLRWSDILFRWRWQELNFQHAIHQPAAACSPFGQHIGQNHLPLEITDSNEHFVAPLAQAHIPPFHKWKRQTQQIHAILALDNLLQTATVENLAGITLAKAIGSQL